MNRESPRDGAGFLVAETFRAVGLVLLRECPVMRTEQKLLVGRSMTLMTLNGHRRMKVSK